MKEKGKEEKEMKKMVVLLVAVLMVGLVACATTTNSFHAPPVTVTPPNPNLPDEFKVFSGKWGGRYWRSSIRLIGGAVPREGYNAVLVVKEIVGDQKADAIYCWNRKGKKVERIWGESPSKVTVVNEAAGCRRWNGNPRWATFQRDKNGNLVLTFSLFRFKKPGDPKSGIHSDIKWEFRYENGKLEGTWSDSAYEWGEVVDSPGTPSIYDNVWHVTMGRLSD